VRHVARQHRGVFEWHTVLRSFNGCKARVCVRPLCERGTLNKRPFGSKFDVEHSPMSSPIQIQSRLRKPRPCSGVSDQYPWLSRNEGLWKIFWSSPVRPSIWAVSYLRVDWLAPQHHQIPVGVVQRCVPLKTCEGSILVSQLHHD